MGSGVRVRLNFDDSCRYICESSTYRSLWFLVNLDRQKTIEGLALELCSRFDISPDLRVELSLDGSLLPRWETTAILRDNDLVTVAAVKEAVGTKRKIGNDCEMSSLAAESNRQHEKKRKRGAVEEETAQENALAPTVAGPKEKKRRKEVKSVEIVQEDTAECGGEDGSLKKRRNRQKQDTCTEFLNLSDFPCEPNSVKGSAAFRSRSCRIICSDEDLKTRSTSEQTGVDGGNRDEQTDSSALVLSAFSASALEETESRFGKNVKVSNNVDEAKSQLSMADLAADVSPDEVQKKSKRTRRSRKNRKEKNRAVLDPKLKNSPSIVSPHTLEASSCDGQRRLFHWQNTDLPWSKTSANSHPQHVIFTDDNDPDSGAPIDQNFVTLGVADRLPNHNTAAAEPVCNKEDVSRPSKDLSSDEPQRICHAMLHSDEQMPQRNETSHDAGCMLERAAGKGCHGSSGQLMIATSSISKCLSHDQKPRQMQSAKDLGPFSNVQVFKRQRGAPKFQSSRSTAEPMLTSKGNNFLAPSYTKPTEDILDVTASETTKNYSLYELLLGPPRPGDVIAYKILQLSADYSPVVSSYKEAKVQKFVPATRIVELESKNLQIPSQLKKSTGRFDLTIEDEHEILTNSVMQDDQLISISWDLLLEPRLVV